MIDKEFWQGKRVFITGHTGFKGSWLSLWLRSLNAEVWGYALTPPTSPSLFVTCGLEKDMHSAIGDIRQAKLLEEMLLAAQPDIVIHMAAQPLVRESYKNPVDTYETNVMGTVNLLEAVRKCTSVKAVVNVTTDKCYENKEWYWGYRENEPMGGYDPYSSSKACAELVTSAYRNSFFNSKTYADHGIALASVRAGNVIGGGDWAPDRLIPDIIHALSNREEVLIRSPYAIRPWQHVLEPLSGYLMVAENLYKYGMAYAEAWNFGSRDEDAKTVEWIVQKLCKLWGSTAAYHIEAGDHPHEASWLKLDCSKAAAELNWQPKWNITVALTKIVEWTKAYNNGENMKAICLRQIGEYMND